MQNAELIRSVADSLERKHSSIPIIVGFDGFVDEIIHVVDERLSTEEYTRIPTIKAFSERVAALAGLSGNIELVTLRPKLGGNGPIMANALISLGNEVSYTGGIGEKEIHFLFRDFASKCKKVISVCEPAHTDALEFNDGKLMLGKTTSMAKVTWDRILAVSSHEEFYDMIKNARLISFTNWTMLPGMNGIIRGITEILSSTGHKPTVFFDLADPSKRTNQDILGLFDLIGLLTEHAQIIFGMNENESKIISRLCGVDEEKLTARAGGIRSKLGVYIAVIHPTHGAAAADVNGNWWVDGPFTPKPKLTTGAGDNFNAGFCHGHLQGLSPHESLVSGVSTSGFYVRNARSPKHTELYTFMRSWADGFE